MTPRHSRDLPTLVRGKLRVEHLELASTDPPSDLTKRICSTDGSA